MLPARTDLDDEFLPGLQARDERSHLDGFGSCADYDEKSKAIELPLTKEGAYLAMIRGENLYASGIVLVTPLEMEVLEEPPITAPGAVAYPGGVRVTVRDARTKEFLPKVQGAARGVDSVRIDPVKRSPQLRAELAPDGELIVGYVGRLAAEKRVDLLAQISRLPGVRLVIVGSGPAA